MRTPALLLVLLVPLAAARAEEPADTLAALQEDLVVEARLTSSATIEPGEPVRLEARLVNRSADRSHRAVRPGDGSESGWREPHVFCTAESFSPRGARLPVRENPVMRCGNFDSAWQRGIVTLAPGESLDLAQALSGLHHRLDFQRAGRTEIRVHYRYTAGHLQKGGKTPDVPDDPGAMRGVPAFEIVSEPVVLEVRRRADLELEALGPLVVGRAQSLTGLLRLRVTNRAAVPQDVPPSQIAFELRPSAASRADFEVGERVPPRARLKGSPYPAGATRTFEGSQAWMLFEDWRLKPIRAGTVTVTAVWAPERDGPVRLRSEPIELQVVAP